MLRTVRPARVWFGAARTRLGLEQVARGEKPSIHYMCVRVAGFDRKRVTERLTRAGVQIVAADERDVLRFRDPNGLVMELRAG